MQRAEDGISRCSLPVPDRGSASQLVSGASADRRAVEAPRDALLRAAVRLLASYFKGRPTSFDLPLAPAEMTPFGLRVLRACAAIPWGETRSYGEVAADAGVPRAARAAGQALGRNPIPVIVPCHRVIGADGRLVGFGSGLDMKQRLLELERTSVSR